MTRARQLRPRHEHEAREAEEKREEKRAAQAPWQRLNFLPEPHQQGSLRPMSLCSLTAGAWANDPDDSAAGGLASAVADALPAAAIASEPAAVSCS